ncbi:MAG: DUF547 domain-containing protein [Planctomycetia bacterium]|nr:DUF547 domain-containing protein [Planctomycetia bacterium]
MRRKLLWFFGLLVLVLSGGVLLAHLARTRIQVGGPGGSGERVPVSQIDHASYDWLLQKYVDDRGLVAYARWKANSADQKALDDYLNHLGTANLLAPASQPAKLAFWINAYNALTLKGILREYPTTSIRQHTAVVGGYNIWRDLLLWVDGKQYSLDDIEHGTLRKMNEPRIHFALVCAARGCPPLRNRAYTAQDVTQQLDDNARQFFARPENLRLDPATKTVFISELFRWYGTDFTETPEDQARMLRRYMPEVEKLAWFDDPTVGVSYLDYDWSLNDQQPASK